MFDRVKLFFLQRYIDAHISKRYSAKWFFGKFIQAFKPILALSILVQLILFPLARFILLPTSTGLPFFCIASVVGVAFLYITCEVFLDMTCLPDQSKDFCKHILKYLTNYLESDDNNLDINYLVKDGIEKVFSLDMNHLVNKSQYALLSSCSSKVGYLFKIDVDGELFYIHVSKFDYEITYKAYKVDTYHNHSDFSVVQEICNKSCYVKKVRVYSENLDSRTFYNIEKNIFLKKEENKFEVKKSKVGRQVYDKTTKFDLFVDSKERLYVAKKVKYKSIRRQCLNFSDDYPMSFRMLPMGKADQYNPVDRSLLPKKPPINYYRDKFPIYHSYSISSSEKASARTLMPYTEESHPFNEGISDEELTKHLKSLCDLFYQLKAQRVVHRDIKPDNIVWGNEKPYLIDFDDAVKLEPNQSHKEVNGYVGTKGFMDPSITSEYRSNGCTTNVCYKHDNYSIIQTLIWYLSKTLKNNEVKCIYNDRDSLRIIRVKKVDGRIETSFLTSILCNRDLLFSPGIEVISLPKKDNLTFLHK